MLMILACVCPPLAVWATQGRSRAMANLGLTCCFFVPGVLDAWSTVDRHQVARRYDAIARFLEA